MLDPRIYRAALVPVLVAILVAAFSIEDRPRPIGTTLAPDAFDGARAFSVLTALGRSAPVRRPGDSGDGLVADRVAEGLAVLGPDVVSRSTSSGQTIDGPRELETLVATRPGRAGPGLVVVAHRDAVGAPAEAELSGTAALIELARVASTGRLRRTITFVSTSGGSGGLAGARAAVDRLPKPVGAVLVLGDLASTRVRKPWVVPWSNGGGTAPLRLSRTVEAAVRVETGQEPGGVRAGGQWARLALALAPTEQGAFGRAGLPAVLLSASGERGPRAGAPVSERRMEVFGRAALRSIFALDNGPDIAAGPARTLVTNRKILPTWAVRALVGAALLAVWLTALDGLARARRRRVPIAAGLGWLLAGTLPFVLAGAFAVLLSLTGLLPATPLAPLLPGAIAADGGSAAAIGALGVVVAIGFLLLRPLALRATGALAADGHTERDAGRAVALHLVITILTFAVWIANPFAAALLVPAAHAWLWIADPEVRVGRTVGVVVALLALFPAVLVGVGLSRALGAGPGDALWGTILLVAGGHIGPATWLAWAGVAGCLVAVVALALVRVLRIDPAAPTVRGPGSYAGPGSLGGTDSGFARR